MTLLFINLSELVFCQPVVEIEEPVAGDEQEFPIQKHFVYVMQKSEDEY